MTGAQSYYWCWVSVSYLFWALCYSSKISLAASCGQTFREYPECSLLSPSVALHWRDEQSNIVFALEVDGKWNWIGLGFSEAGGMLGTDMAILRRNETSDGWWIGDYWSMQFGTPSLDKRQDVSFLSAGWIDGKTYGTFRRPLDTCDEEEDRRIIPGTIHYLVFAYNNLWGYHGLQNRGNTQLKLLSPRSNNGMQNPPLPAVTPKPASDGDVWKLQMANVSIPTRATTYLCRDFEVPSPLIKVHVTEWKVTIDNPGYVHHMVIYSCTGRPANPREKFECTDMDPDCLAFFGIWAPGADHFVVPDAAGLAVGGDSGVGWVSLQVHYTNLAGTPGLLDSSGFLITYTTALRQYDMGILTLGIYDINIPPGKSNFTSKPNICPSACTQRLPQPVTIVQAGFHMHTLGQSIRTQWFRNGKELPPLGTRRAYDYNFQGVTYIDPANNQLLPGDELITTCSWNSTSRKKATVFGLATKDEMCFNFLSYYPRVPDIEMCISRSPGLLGGRTMALCTTFRSYGELDSLAKFEAMRSSGEIVDVPLRNYTSYNGTCKSNAGINGTTPDPITPGPVSVQPGPAVMPRVPLAPPPKPKPIVGPATALPPAKSPPPSAKPGTALPPAKSPPPGAKPATALPPVKSPPPKPSPSAKSPPPKTS